MDKSEQTVPVPRAQKKPRASGEPQIITLTRYRGIVTASRLLDEQRGEESKGESMEDTLLDQFKKKTKRATRDDKIRPKYEIEIAYQGKKGETKLKKVQCGIWGSIDRSTCTLGYTKQQADQSSRMMACRDEFDKDLFDKAGGALNPNFWAFNLDWCDADGAETFTDRLLVTDLALRRYAAGTMATA